MGGGGNVFDKIYKDITAPVNETLGFVSDTLTNVTTEAGKGYDYITGKTAREQEKQEKKAKDKAKAEVKKAKEEQKKQEGFAEDREMAEEKREGRRKRQAGRRRTGRRSTILTDTLGDVGGEDNTGRKSLLGY